MFVKLYDQRTCRSVIKISSSMVRIVSILMHGTKFRRVEFFECCALFLFTFHTQANGGIDCVVVFARVNMTVSLVLTLSLRFVCACVPVRNKMHTKFYKHTTTKTY